MAQRMRQNLDEQIADIDRMIQEITGIDFAAHLEEKTHRMAAKRELGLRLVEGMTRIVYPGLFTHRIQ